MTDFKNAPKGATHWCPITGEFYREYLGEVQVWESCYNCWSRSIVFKSINHDQLRPLNEQEKDMKKEFSKSDLKTGMKITFKDGDEGIVVFGCNSTNGQEDIILSLEGGYYTLSYFDENFKCEDVPDCDIIKVEMPKYYSIDCDKFTTLWEEQSQEQKDYEEALLALKEAQEKVEKLKPKK